MKREQEIPAKEQISSVRDVPTLRDIQEALVTMEDKQQSFIGSREWIGSFEICLCLDYFYEVYYTPTPSTQTTYYVWQMIINKKSKINLFSSYKSFPNQNTILNDLKLMHAK